MNEFEKQMLAMMQAMKADIAGIKGEIAEMKADIQRLDQKVDAGFAELREADRVIAEGITKITDELGENQMMLTKRIDTTDSVVSRLLFDVAVLKQKVG